MIPLINPRSLRFGIIGHGARKLNIIYSENDMLMSDIEVSVLFNFSNHDFSIYLP